MLFLPGLELCRRFYEEVVRPLLAQHFPQLSYAAARIGPGSDVTGFDTAMSMDHDWGPGLQLFLREQDASLIPEIDERLRTDLPYTFAGFPVHFAAGPGETTMLATTTGPVNHRVALLTVRAFCQDRLAYDSQHPLTVAHWLTIPSQELLEMTTGAVYHDGVGELTALRSELAWYPHDIWLYLLAAGWQRIGQEEHVMPRAGSVGDELGSALVGSRLVHDIMSLCFLLERRYAPYAKWFGTAFKRLACVGELSPVLWRAQIAQTWQEREAALSEAYSLLAHMHNALDLTEPLPENVSHFYDRPFLVIHAEAFTQALLSQINDPAVKRVAQRKTIGNIDQFSDNTDLRSYASWRPILRGLYT